MAVTSIEESVVAIVGPGLVGGSLGLALAGRCARRLGVVGPHDAAQDVLDCNAVDEVVELDAAAQAADVIVLAAPVRAAARLAREVGSAARPGTVLTDVCAAQRFMGEAYDEVADGVEVVGGHPMAGGEVHGIGAARADLFVGRPWVICQHGRSTSRALDLVRELVEVVGAVPIELDAADHDRRVALVSHAVYAVGQALAHAASDADRVVAGGGFRDATRLARSGGSVWTDVLLANGDELALALRKVRDELATLVELVDAGDADELSAWLDAARS